MVLNQYRCSGSLKGLPLVLKKNFRIGKLFIDASKSFAINFVKNQAEQNLKTTSANLENTCLYRITN
jgi:hypothetical protein